MSFCIRIFLALTFAVSLPAFAQVPQPNAKDLSEHGLYAWMAGDFDNALKWYRAAADQGDTDAENALGFLYSAGAGVPQDFDQALMWYRRAAEKGDPAGLDGLAGMYANGNGVQQDYIEARRLYAEAANKGYGIAASSLGMMYYNGNGVGPDYEQAMYWFRKAIAAGDATNYPLLCQRDEIKFFKASVQGKAALDKVIEQADPLCVEELKRGRQDIDARPK